MGRNRIVISQLGGIAMWQVLAEGTKLACEFKISTPKSKTMLTQALMNKGLLQIYVEASLAWRLGQNSQKGSISLGLY